MVMQQIQMPAAFHQLWCKYRDLPSGIVLFKIDRVIENRADHEPVGRSKNHEAWAGQPDLARRFFHQVKPPAGEGIGLLIVLDMQR